MDKKLYEDFFSSHYYITLSHYPHLIFIVLLIHPQSYNIIIYTLHTKSSYDFLSILYPITLFTLFTLDLHMTTYLSRVARDREAAMNTLSSLMSPGMFSPPL